MKGELDDKVDNLYIWWRNFGTSYTFSKSSLIHHLTVEIYRKIGNFWAISYAACAFYIAVDKQNLYSAFSLKCQ